MESNINTNTGLVAAPARLNLGVIAVPAASQPPRPRRDGHRHGHYAQCLNNGYEYVAWVGRNSQVSGRLTRHYNWPKIDNPLIETGVAERIVIASKTQIRTHGTGMYNGNGIATRIPHV